MISISFLLLLFSNLAVSTPYYYFIGQGDDLSNCNTVKEDIKTNPQNCPNYKDKYFLNCTDDLTNFFCEESDTSFDQIPPNDKNQFNLLIASNLMTVNLSKLIQVDSIKIASFQSNEDISSNTLYLVGCTPNANSLFLNSLKINVTDQDMFVNNLQLNNIEIIDNKNKINAINLGSDQNSLEKLVVYENNSPIHASEYKYYDNIINVKITFTSKSWDITYKRDEEGSFVEGSMSIPYSIAGRFYLDHNGENLTFNIDDPNTAKLQPVRLKTISNFFLFATGDWSSLDSIPLEVTLSGSKYDYPNYESLDRRFFNFIFQTQTGGIIKSKTEYYFIGQGDEYEQCLNDKAELASDCDGYSDKYMINCRNPFNFSCNQNDEKLKQIQLGSNDALFIIVGSNTQPIDLAKLPNIRVLYLMPLSFNKKYAQDGDPKDSITLKGCNIPATITAIGLLNINIQNADLLINYLHLMKSKIIESSFNLKTEKLLLNDEYSLSNLPKDKYITNQIDVSGDSTRFYNLKITFDSNQWIVSGYDYESSDTLTVMNIPYYLADMLYMSTDSDIVTLNVDEPSTATFKTIQIYSSLDALTFKSTGNWDSLTCDPLTIILDESNNVKQYTTDSVNKEHVIFKPNIYPELEIYYFIGNGEELNKCKSMKEAIESDSTTCSDYKNEYMINCESDYKIYCEENDAKFEEALSAYGYKYKFNIMTDLNSATINLPKLAKADEISIVPHGELNGSPSKTVSLIGCDINERILSLFGLKVKIVQEDLNASYLILTKSEIINSEFNLGGDIIQIDNATANNLQDNMNAYFNKIIYTSDKEDITISFNKDKWNIIENGDKNNQYSVPYFLGNRLHLACNCNKLTFNVDDQSTAILKSVEISFLNNNDQHEIKLTSTGNWIKPLAGPLYIYCEYMDFINKDALDDTWFKFNEKPSDVEIPTDTESDDNKPYSNTAEPETNTQEYIPPESVNDTTSKDNNDVGTVNITANEDPESIRKKIEEMFDSSKTNSTQNETTDDVVTIASGGVEIEFKDLDLKENQYIKVENDADIKLTSGKLNLVLDDKSNSVNVNVANNKDVELSIKNMDSCTVKLKADVGDNEEKKSISINSNSEVYGPLKFATESVKDIEIKSINLHSLGSIESDVPVKVVTLVAQPNTAGKISNVNVSKTFTIAQTAALELDQVSLKDANVNLNLHTYTASNYEKPMLTGTLEEPPSLITLNKPENSNSKQPSEDDKFLLFRGTFTSSCKAWVDRLDFGDTYFNAGSCDDYTELKMLGEKKSLNVLRKGKPPQSNNDGKLTSAQIAGIVVGCIVGVAIIVVVVVVVVIKKKKNKNQQSSGGEDEQDDL